MRIGPNDNQLYVASFMTLLRRYQRQDVVPDFSKFIEEVKEACSVKGQSGPLDQRIALLESMVAESEVNKSIANESMDLQKALDSKLNLIIADLTDPLLSKDEANCLFQVMAEQFRSIPVPGGKVLALDEAHKFMDGVQSDGLSEAIVNVARLMRHDGMRLIVSTQSPKALAPELLELVSVALLHHFHSKDWWTYLRQKLPLPDEVWEKILSLSPGSAIAFASRSAVTGASSHVLQLHVRPRLTADLGGSRTNQ
jgi:DNA phosphorothioation-dependent restriction protein DptH